MKSALLSHRVLGIISAAGWYEGRHIDTAPIKSFLECHSVAVSQAAETFLREFHGLQLNLPEGGLSFVKFDVLEELNLLETGERERLERIVKDPLCPIGHGGRFLLFITPSSSVIFLHDDWLLYLRAKSIPDALEVICIREFKNYETVMLTDEQMSARPDREQNSRDRG
jgi:hypothetical protein